ncbi:uncharacterized protein B0I36DRAFT_320892 [Microdochium trichocladiopsis]|uniref:Uncharacterized protein n=1 Tax=Microdochium trichocladiopsis TaxID=1682393 RepID=A0A9P8Y8K3_9PEZI|nr:uncharacterized protein B0I36DRAFT_320892 [Microdochium trichocladiopsis]KAH7033154.1 hypothetical protein B0I36DRAFT_320892 [Microdochium trichocladiopsis]
MRLRPLNTQDRKQVESSDDDVMAKWLGRMEQLDLDTLFRLLSAADYLDMDQFVFECNKVIDRKLRSKSEAVSLVAAGEYGLQSH